MTTYTFDTTGDAYDDCQTSDDIKNGDTLVIADEGVVGLAWTWPVAVTAEHGALHTIAPEANVYDVAADAKWRLDQVRAAIAEALKRELPLHPAFDCFVVDDHGVPEWHNRP